MKKTIFYLIMAMVIIACNGQGYKISGTIEGLNDGDVVTLCSVEEGQLVEVDSAKISNGKYSFSGNIDTTDVRLLTFTINDEFYTCTFFLESGNIKVNYINGIQSVSGTKTNVAFQDFYNQAEELNQEALNLEERMQKANSANEDLTLLKIEMSNLQDSFIDVIAASIDKNCDNAFGFRQLLDYYDMFEPERISEFLEKMSATYGSNLIYQDLKTMTDSQLLTVSGQKFSDFEASIIDQSGNLSTAKLSDYVSSNKVILLDFWASWCAPCRNEIPNLIAIYDKFKDRGFTIVSVSVDENMDEWKKAIEEEGMTWPQLIDTLSSPQSPAGKYSVSAIPSTFLIDGDGIILGRNLRGKEIGVVLDDFFKDK